MVLHTSTPSFASDVKTVRALKAANPNLKIGMIGAKVAVDAAGSLAACEELDFVARNEFDFTIKEVAEGRDFGSITGLSYRGARRPHRPQRRARRSCTTWTSCRSSRRSTSAISTIENYFIGYLRHPYMSFYTGRGCKSRCTFCLWPQTVGGHNYRTRSVGHVIDELKWAMKAFPQVKEVFFDDDTLTDDLPRVEALAAEIGKLGIIWACNAKGNVPRKTLEGAGQQRLPAVRWSATRPATSRSCTTSRRACWSTSRGSSPRTATSSASRSTAPSSSACPGETKETIQETIRFAKEINPHTIQVSLAAPYPGTFLYKQAKENGWFDTNNADLVDDNGIQIAPLQLSASEPHRNFQLGRGVLQAVLFPRAEDRRRSSARWCARRR